MKVSEAVHMTHSFDAKPKRRYKNCENRFYRELVN